MVDTSDIKFGRLSRQDCVGLLESVCIQCYDDETMETLREAVRSNVEDGTIPKYAVEQRT